MLYHASGSCFCVAASPPKPFLLLAGSGLSPGQVTGWLGGWVDGWLVVGWAAASPASLGLGQPIGFDLVAVQRAGFGRVLGLLRSYIVRAGLGYVWG